MSGRLAAVAALLAVSLVVVVAPSSTAGPDASGLPRLMLDVSNYEDRTTTATAATMTPAEKASGIGPGSRLLIDFESARALCTANFVWRDGSRYFLGAAGHCFMLDAEKNVASPDDLDGLVVRVCVADCNFGGYSALVGSFVEDGTQTKILTGTTVALGTVAYARQRLGDMAVGNDFGLVEVPATLVRLLRPAMPVFGGVSTVGQIDLGDPVCHYGAGSTVGETFLSMGRVGAGIGTETLEGWWDAVLEVQPGDSGSAVQVCELTDRGMVGVEAAGILTHGAIGVGVLAAGTTVPRAIEMAREAGLFICLVLGDGSCTPTARFTTGCSGTTCTFDGRSSVDADGPIGSYRWDFGDGVTATGGLVTRRYGQKTKNYMVTLTVTDDDGVTGTARRKIACSYGGGSYRCR